MKLFEKHPTSLANLFVAATLAGAADERTAQYWVNHPADRATKLRECMVQAATMANSPDCVNAGRAAAAALGSGTPVSMRASAALAAPSSPSEQACTMEALKAIWDKKVLEDMASACIRRGTFKPSSSKRAR